MEDFLGGKFFGGIFWEKCFGRIFGTIFLGRFFWDDFFERIFWDDFCEDYFWRNSLGGIICFILKYVEGIGFFCQDDGFCQDFV